MLKSLHKLTSDESLYVKFAKGNATAFEVLYDRHKDGLFAYLHRSRLNVQLIEEIAQDTWLAVIDSAQDYKGAAKFRTFLFAIAHRKLADHWRRNIHEHDRVRVEADNQTATEGLGGSAAGIRENMELTMDLLQALESLSREQQQAYLLKEEGFSRKEIAVMTGSSEETIKSRIRYANNHLRRLLEVQYAE